MSRMMERRVGMVGAALSAMLAASAAGCDLEIGGEGADLGELPLISMNSLAWENLSDNLPSVRAVVTAPLRQSPAIAALADTAEGLQVLAYAVTCALPAGEVVKLENNAGDVFALEGRLGVDRDWQQAPPTVRDIECTAGCMAAHLNGLGKQISISVRGRGCGYAIEPAERYYNFEEGGFAADSELHIYTCTGRDLVQACGRQAAPTLQYRACTKGHPGCGQIIECGECSKICRGWSPQDGYTQCMCNRVPVNMTTTFLEDGNAYSCEG